MSANVFALLDEKRARERRVYLTARDVQRARLVRKAEQGRALLARMEKDGLLVGEDVVPPDGGHVVRVYRGVIEENPVPG